MGNVFNIERHSLPMTDPESGRLCSVRVPAAVQMVRKSGGTEGKSLFVFKQQCTGCGMCVSACSRSAISIVGGKSIRTGKSAHSAEPALWRVPRGRGACMGKK